MNSDQKKHYPRSKTMKEKGKGTRAQEGKQKENATSSQVVGISWPINARGKEARNGGGTRAKHTRRIPKKPSQSRGVGKKKEKGDVPWMPKVKKEVNKEGGVGMKGNRELLASKTDIFKKRGRSKGGGGKRTRRHKWVTTLASTRVPKSNNV